MPAPSKAPVAVGERVLLRLPSVADGDPFCSAARASRRLHTPWVSAPATRQEFGKLLARSKTEDFRCLLMVRREDDRIAGVFNLSQIFRGNFLNAYLGYYAMSPFAGKGYMRE